MSEVPPIQPSFESSKEPFQGSDDLSKEDLEASVLAQNLLGVKGKTDSEKIIPKETLPPSTDHDLARFAPQDIGTYAIGNVEVSLHRASIHFKWADSGFAEKYVTEGGKGRLITDIKRARAQIEETKTEYRRLLQNGPESEMKRELLDLLKTGTMRKVEGGKGGVYFLCNDKGKPKFVIKPADEGLLALNNGKNFASPFLDKDGICSPVPGIGIYEAAKNSEIAYKAAELFGLASITPETEIMILEHPIFHDILDGISDDLAEAGPPDREKVCTVQRFIDNGIDVGALLMESMKMGPEEMEELQKSSEAYERAVDAATPKDIDQLSYGRVALLAFIIGESDGNAGNFICTRNVATGEMRLVYKIDNAASFPDDNKNLRPELSWLQHNYALPFPEKLRKLIQSLDLQKIEELKIFMASRGKSKASIEAFDERIKKLAELTYNPLDVFELEMGMTAEPEKG